MTLLSIVLLAAMNASGLIRSPTQINQRDGISLNELAKSPLAGLSEDMKAGCLAEHVRVGTELVGVLGFSFGKTLPEYGFKTDLRLSENPAYPVLFLPEPVFGFSRFRPLLVTDRLCGVLLCRPVGPCEDEEALQAALANEQEAVRTNLVATLGLSTNDLAVASNGVAHVWRLSFERWRESLVLRIGDRELMSRLARAALDEVEAQHHEQIQRLMKVEDKLSGTSEEGAK